MHNNKFTIEDALRSMPKLEVPQSTLDKVDNVLANLENRKVEKHKMKFKTIFLIAAVIAISISICGVAVATNFFGLRDLAIPSEETTIDVPAPGGGFEEQPMQLISLQGFTGSPEYEAAAEWQAYLDTLDINAILADVGNDWGDVPELYRWYGAYNLL